MPVSNVNIFFPLQIKLQHLKQFMQVTNTNIVFASLI